MTKLFAQVFAQATNVPTNGASNAQDFQPQTRNPQATRSELQPGSVPQATDSQDILSNENARIVVPVGPAQTVTPLPVSRAGGINWFLVGIAVIILGAGLQYAVRRRKKPLTARPQTATKRAAPQEVSVVLAEASVSPPVAEQIPDQPVDQPKEKPLAKAPGSSSKKPHKRAKSKSKRKKSRK